MTAPQKEFNIVKLIGIVLLHLIGAGGLTLLIYGQYTGLFVVPPDGHMGDIARILFVHVPSAWNSMAVYTVGFVVAVLSLVTMRKGFDHALVACLEVGTLLTVLLIIQGSIFARLTWGVWWTWDPRLSSSAGMLLTYVGVLILRTLIVDADRKAVVTAVVTILASATVPLTYFSVQLWRSIHQLQTAPTDIDDPLKFAWRINAIAFALIAVWLIGRRYRIAQHTYESRKAPPLPPADPPPMAEAL
ncbi:MAG: cytochrome c biogenesis protein CcsA [Myxococcota bacterium]